MKRFTAIFAIVLLAAGSMLAQGRGYNRSNCDGTGPNFDGRGARASRGMMAKGQQCRIPNLTEEQQTKINAMRTAHQKEMLPMRNQMGEYRAQMRTLQTKANPDMDAINSLIDKMSSLKSKMMKQRAAHKQEVRSLLTEEQKLAFDTRQGFGRRGQKGGKGHCGMGRGW